MQRNELIAFSLSRRSLGEDGCSMKITEDVRKCC
jgi:hypothetical protein